MAKYAPYRPRPAEPTFDQVQAEMLAGAAAGLLGSLPTAIAAATDAMSTGLASAASALAHFAEVVGETIPAFAGLPFRTTGALRNSL